MIPPVDARHALLESLYRNTDLRARIAHDPVRIVHRYTDPADQAIAGFVAAGFAFGRVDLFLPVLDRLFDHMDAHAGPDAFVRNRTRTPLKDAAYRWIKPADLDLLWAGLARTLDRTGSLEAAFAPQGTLEQRIDGFVATLRRNVCEANGLSTLPRGVLTFLPSPLDGSACKRLNLWLRWMVRPATEGVDFGIFTSFHPRELLIPLDVHVGRLARLLGLTTRKDASWRTAREITAALAAFDPEDPVRFDFALAHLGISGACVGVRMEAICASCTLEPVCRAPVATSRRAR